MLNVQFVLFFPFFFVNYYFVINFQPKIYIFFLLNIFLFLHFIKKEISSKKIINKFMKKHKKKKSQKRKGKLIIIIIIFQKGNFISIHTILYSYFLFYKFFFNNIYKFLFSVCLFVCLLAFFSVCACMHPYTIVLITFFMLNIYALLLFFFCIYVHKLILINNYSSVK